MNEYGRPVGAGTVHTVEGRDAGYWFERAKTLECTVLRLGGEVPPKGETARNATDAVGDTARREKLEARLTDTRTRLRAEEAHVDQLLDAIAQLRAEEQAGRELTEALEGCVQRLQEKVRRLEADVEDANEARTAAEADAADAKRRSTELEQERNTALRDLNRTENDRTVLENNYNVSAAAESAQEEENRKLREHLAGVTGTDTQAALLRAVDVLRGIVDGLGREKAEWIAEREALRNAAASSAREA